ncbi:MAG TPA: hypothetical protein VJU81_24270, partial [Methylomirabilota bacterium]|nr:hypothetical protein [Methylomirabilota bacterium]
GAPSARLRGAAGKRKRAAVRRQGMSAPHGEAAGPAVERLGKTDEERDAGRQRQQEDQPFLRHHVGLTSSVSRLR